MRCIISENKYLIYEPGELTNPQTISTIIQEENGVQESLKVVKKIKISKDFNIKNSILHITFSNGDVCDFVYDGGLYFIGKKTTKTKIKDYTTEELITEIESRGYIVRPSWQ